MLDAQEPRAKSQEPGAKRLLIPAILTVIALGVASPFAVRAYKNKVLSDNERAVFQVVKAYAAAQAERFAKDGAYAQELSELNPAWAAADMDALKPGEIHGYRLRILTAQHSSAPGGAMSYRGADGRMTGGYGLLAAPVKYGFTGRHTFLSSAAGIYIHDFDVKGDVHTSALQYFAIPAAAERLD